MVKRAADRSRRPGIARISGAILDVVHRCSAGLRADGRGPATNTLRPGIRGSSTWMPVEATGRTRAAAPGYALPPEGPLTDSGRSAVDSSSVIGQCRTVWDTREGD